MSLAPYDQPQPPPRQPPACLEAEQALLGAVLTNNEAFHRAAAIVRPEHFAEDVHRRIFDVVGQLVRSERTATRPALLTFLGDQDLGGITTKAYLTQLAADATTVINAPDYAVLVRDTALRRDLITVAAELTEAAHDARVDIAPDAVAADALERIRSIVEQAPRQSTRFQIGDGVAGLVERVERIRRGEIKPRGIHTGWSDFDRATGGLQPGTIVLVAARPAMGKTVLMTNLAFNVARQGIGALEFSLEVPADQLQARHVAQVIFSPHRPVPFGDILTAQGLDDRDVEAIIDAQRGFRDIPLVAECPKKAMTAAEIAARIHVEKKRMASAGVTLGVVLIDYLDKIAASDRYRGQRTYEIQEIVDVLKVAALAEDVCVVLLAQLNRGTEGREDKRPNAADIKSSGYLEQEAHVIVFLYRPAYYIAKSQEYREQDNPGHAEKRAEFDRVEHDVELIIGKNRGGAEGTVNLWGDVGCSIFSSRGRG